MIKINYTYPFYKTFLVAQKLMGLAMHVTQGAVALNNLHENHFVSSIYRTDKIHDLMALVDDTFQKVEGAQLWPTYMPKEFNIHFTRLAKVKLPLGHQSLGGAILGEDRILLNMDMMYGKQKAKLDSIEHTLLSQHHKEYAQFIILHELGHFVLYHTILNKMEETIRNGLFRKYFLLDLSVRLNPLLSNIADNISEGFADTFAIYAYALLNPGEKNLIPLKHALRHRVAEKFNALYPEELFPYDIAGVYEDLFKTSVPLMNWQQLIGLCLKKSHDNIEHVLKQKLSCTEFREAFMHDPFLPKYLHDGEINMKKLIGGNFFIYQEPSCPANQAQYLQPAIASRENKILSHH